MLFALLALAAALDAVEPPPAISQGGIVNAASRMPPALAAGGIARGALFHIVGPRVGTSIDLHASGRDIPIQPLHTSPTRLVARMPLDAPLGRATITVSRDGQSSAPEPVNIVETAFGIFYVGLDPELPSSVRDAVATGRLATQDRPPVARSGQKLYIFGTGLGAGKSKPEVFVGDRRARTAYELQPVPGLEAVDRIAVEPDPATPAGCYVPVQVVVAGRSSNASAIGISDGSACAETLPWLSAHASGPRRAANVFLVRSSFMTDVNFAIRGATYTWDDLAASFAATNPKQPLPIPLPPVGTCTAYTGVLNVNALTRSQLSGGGPEDLIDATAGGGASNTVEPPPMKSLDAGSAITIEGPRGRRTVAHSPGRPGSFAAVLGGHPLFKKGDPTPEFLVPGDYRVTAPGGPGIGALAEAIRLDPPPMWRNRKSTDAVRLAKGLTVRWTAAAPGRLIVVAATNTDAETGAFAAAVCLAAAGARSFRVPPHVLANIPKGKSGTSLPTNVVVVGSVPVAPARFEARGLDSGVIVDLTTSARTVRFE